jgi:predicted Rdx family selenoprotein
VDLQRRSHYLDGPTAGEWIFRNQLLTTREESVYVDLVHDEDGNRWSSPARYDSIHFGAETSLQDLVLALHQTGCMTRRALDVIAEEWEQVALDDDTHWREASAANRRIMERLLDGGLAAESVTSQDVHRVIDRWGFPLAGLDLTEAYSQRAAARRAPCRPRPPPRARPRALRGLRLVVDHLTVAVVAVHRHQDLAPGGGT